MAGLGGWLVHCTVDTKKVAAVVIPDTPVSRGICLSSDGILQLLWRGQQKPHCKGLRPPVPIARFAGPGPVTGTVYIRLYATQADPW